MKFFVFSIEENDSRVNRFRQELAKFKFELVEVQAYETLIKKNRIFYRGQELVFNKDDFCWLFGNSMANQYINSVLKGKEVSVWPTYTVSKIFSDKFLTADFFENNGIKTPETIMINSYSKAHLAEIVNVLGGFPCVIKNVKGSQGIRVALVNNFSQIKDFIIKDKQKGLEEMITPYKKTAYFLQEYIEGSKGVDYRVLCLGGEVLGGMKRSSKDDFRSNISLGGKGEIFKVDEKLRETCLKIMKKGELFYAGIDFVKKGDEFIAIEVNTSAEFKGFEEFVGINVVEKIITKIIENY
ncbi:MAG: RimK family alpha-L-glutamate ligase [Candidatus Moranbacteria bacterium]|nr:RimK family alpha-L-glutamate ligase [Candidatus Moranbacteria bacterium]